MPGPCIVSALVGRMDGLVCLPNWIIFDGYVSLSGYVEFMNHFLTYLLCPIIHIQIFVQVHEHICMYVTIYRDIYSKSRVYILYIQTGQQISIDAIV